MIMALYMASFCLVLAFEGSSSRGTGIILTLIGAALATFADFKYTQLKQRVEKLEQKGGDSDA
ncbi:MAG: hypothetical protein E7441_08045 [Ruminococcaceae bacterium]|nr:hypothetical protein [Oscillospiraceae bacterium]